MTTKQITWKSCEQKIQKKLWPLFPFSFVNRNGIEVIRQDITRLHLIGHMILKLEGVEVVD